MNEREDFTTATKAIIAGRAGYRCSFPSCGRVTVGPGAVGARTASIGVACHIFGASPHGPRGQGGLTSDQLRSAENGFWACQNHAKLVDTNDGGRYPASQLLGWRDLHEARIHREMGGLRLPVNWVESIKITTSPRVSRAGPLFARDQHLSLSRVTLLVGANGSGKTALCEWLEVMTDEQALSRWHGADLHIALTLHNPETHVLVVQSRGRGFTFLLDGVPVPFNPLPVAVHVLRSAAPGNGRSDIEWFSAWLGVTTEVLRRLVATLNVQGSPFFDRVAITEAGAIQATLRGEQRALSAGQLTGSSVWMLALALAVVRAGNAALHAPTLLVLDSVGPLNAEKKALVLGELARQERFQSLATLPMADPALLPWRGSSIIRIKEGPGGASIEEA